MDVTDPVAAVLTHHGVKGMKWGVRKDKGHEGESAKNTKIAKLDRKFEKDSQSFKTLIKVYNAGAEQTNKVDIPRINNKPQYKDQDFSRDSPLRKKYYAEHQKAMLDNLEKAANDLGTNASGTRKLGIVEAPDGGWDIVSRDVKHDDTISAHVNVDYDDNGYILSVDIVEPDLEHIDPLEAVLAHHGIKGMRWGQRKAGTGKASSHKKAEAPKSADAEEAHGKKAQAKEKGVHTLSNAELKKVNERLNLEQNYSRLVTEKSKLDKGHAAVKTALALTATAASVYAALNSPMFKAGKLLLDTQLKGALDAAIPAGKGTHRIVEEAIGAASKLPRHKA